MTTPGINTLQELADSSQSLVGLLGKAALERMSFDRAFLGAYASPPRTGSAKPTTPKPDSKSSWPGGVGRVYVLADSSKLGLRPSHA